MIKKAIKYFKKLYLVTNEGTRVRTTTGPLMVTGKGRGRWSKYREYKALDIVRYRGMAYISAYFGKGIRPTDTTNWVPMNVLKVYIKEIDG